MTVRPLFLRRAVTLALIGMALAAGRAHAQGGVWTQVPVPGGPVFAVADGDSGCVIQRGASETTVSGNRWERCRTGLLGWDVGPVRYHGNAIVDSADPDHAVTIGP